ncbi:MAG: tRNA 2-selenouridine(34) synthase MnmH [Pseudomonadota bacterium]
MSAQLPLVSDYRALFLSQRPLLDVRAPVEFNEGAFPHTTNLPLLNDDERHQVGICYKQQGQDAAIALGYALVDEASKAARIAGWENWARQHPDGVLYCFRGGLRSRLTQQMLFEESGVVVPRVAGGYKAMRRFLLETLAAEATRQKLWVIGGRTGCGKTDLLQSLPNSVDLEGIAHHRGSSFGRHAQAQPTQINLENALAIRLLQLSDAPSLVLEDESRALGSREVPYSLYTPMSIAPLLLLEAGLEERVQQSYKDYVLDTLHEFQCIYCADEAFARYSEHVHASLDRIHRRLGGLRHAAMKGLLDEGLRALQDDDATPLQEFVRRLLVDYYDPMYDYQISRKQERIVFRGERAAVQEWLAQQDGRVT